MVHYYSLTGIFFLLELCFLEALRSKTGLHLYHWKTSNTKSQSIELQKLGGCTVYCFCIRKCTQVAYISENHIYKFEA